MTPLMATLAAGGALSFVVWDAAHQRHRANKKTGTIIISDRRRFALQVLGILIALGFWVHSVDYRMHLSGLMAAVAGLFCVVWFSIDPVAAETDEIRRKRPEGSNSEESGRVARKDLPCYSIEEVRKHSSAEDCWFVIEDMVYDATSFARSHPGGPLVIWASAGRDVTDPFHAFHPAGTERRLAPLLVGTLTGYTPSEVVQDFRELRYRLVEEGFFEIDRAFFATKFLWVMMLVVGAAALAGHSTSSSSPWACTILGALLLGTYFQQLAGLGHDMGHNSVLHLRLLDRSFGLIIGNMLSGISLGWWKKSHNIHHVVTNSIEYDPDIQHLPVVAVSESYFNNVFSMYHFWTLRFGQLEKAIISYQHFIYFPLMGLARVNLYMQSWLYACGWNSHSHAVQWQELEVICLGLFVCWLVCLLRLLPSFLHMGVFWLLSHAVAGLLHVQINISHFSMEKYNGVTYKNDSESWIHTQCATSMDVDCVAWMDWFHIGLQFQIEHHLFPRLPRHNLRKVQELIEPLCRKHGIKYSRVPWLDAITATYQCLKGVAELARLTEPSKMNFRDSLLYAGLQAEG